MIYLADVNLWLALAFESHVHHASAAAWFRRLPSTDLCAFCRMTQQGFLRLATNPKAFGKEAVTLAEAWGMYDAFIADSRVTIVDEPQSIESAWREYTLWQAFSPKVWNDAYLAALARDAGYEVVSFDKGFAQYAGLTCTLLS